MSKMKNDLFSLPYGIKVVQHSYRTAFIPSDSIMFSMDRRNAEATCFEKDLALKAGAFVDNHTAYACTTREGQTFYIMCSDSSIHIGMKLIQQNW